MAQVLLTGGDYIEVTTKQADIIDRLIKAQKPVPIIINHQTYSLDQIMGVVVDESLLTKFKDQGLDTSWYTKARRKK